VVSELDIQVGSGLGTFSWRDAKACDTALPNNLDDVDLSLQHVNAPRPPEDCTLVQVEICVFRLVSILGEINPSYHTIKAPTRQEVEVLDQKLECARSRLPEKLQMKPLEQSFIDSPTQIIDRLRLEFIYLRGLCLLYRRYLGDEQYSQERDRRVQAASSMVALCASMLPLCQPGQQLAPLKILIIRYLHDFNFAAVLLCAELKNGAARPPFLNANSTSSHVDLALIRPKLLTACQLWNEIGRPSAKASVALHAITSFLQDHPSGEPSRAGSDLGFEGANMPYLSHAYGGSALNSFVLSPEFNLPNEDPSTENGLIHANPRSAPGGTLTYSWRPNGSAGLPDTYLGANI
jgi:hypothetical protein